MGIKLAYISDQKFYRHQQNWYTTASFNIDFFLKELDVDEWVFWGRLYETQYPEKLFKIADRNHADDVRFSGSWEKHAGLLGYLTGVLEAARRIKAIIRQSDIVWLKLPFFYSFLAARYCTRDQVVVVHQTGDGGAAFSEIFPRFKILSKIIVHQCKKITVKADIAVFVSRHLATQNAPAAVPVIICHESRVTEKIFVDKPRAVNGPWKGIYVGRLSPEKCVDDIIKALSYTQDIDLMIVGSGPEQDKLEELARRLGIAHRIKWLGVIPWGEGLFNLMRDCQSLILASSTEGLPLVLVEAMSQGLPVIATNVGGIPELVRHERNGLLVPVHSPKEIARSLQRLKDNPAWRLELASAALEQSRDHTLQKQMGPLIQKIVEVYRTKISSRE